jgi:hypothetical protein
MHNHVEDSEAILNRQILNNSVKRRATEELSERRRRLIRKELQIQDLDTLTYKDRQNNRRNIHKTRSSKLLPLATNIEETLEALSALQVLTSSKERFLLVNDSGGEKTATFLANPTYIFLIPLIGSSLTGLPNQRRRIPAMYLQFMDSATGSICYLHFSYWPNNIKRHTRLCSDMHMICTATDTAKLGATACPAVFMLTSKPPFPTQ